MSRAVHIDGVEYPYKVGRGGIRVWLPNGKSLKAKMSELTGWTPDELDRAEWKGYWPPIKPSYVKEWLIKHLASQGG